MLDNQLYAIVRTIILNGLAALDLSDVKVQQSYQPTQQGIPLAPTAFLSIIGYHRYGTPAVTDVWDEEAEIEIHTETQYYETRFQVSALSTQNPSDVNQLTAGDIINYITYIMQSQATIATLQAQGIGIERITDIMNIKFLDDRQRFEASPSFDFVLTHKQIVESEVPVIQSTELQIYSI